MAEASELRKVPVPGGQVPVSVWLPEGGTGPGIVVCQEIFGVGAYVRQRCSDLAGLGYVVAAPHCYWRIGETALDDSTPEALGAAVAASQRLDWDEAVGDVLAVQRWLRDEPEVAGEPGLLGFCWGGGVAFAAAAQSAPACLVAYYGSALPSLLELAPEVTCPSLHHFGTADAYVPLAQQAAIRQAVQVRDDVVWCSYEGAGHAFDNPNPMFHHAEASAEAWTTTTAFLQRFLPTSA